MIRFSPLFRKVFRYSCIAGACLLLFVLGCNLWIVTSTRSGAYDDVRNIPFNRVALVLGTNPQTRGDYQNPYFLERMEAARQLYENGKINYFILSGDNHRHGYNEPEEMRKALLKRGVPDSLIFLDYAGFRTLDSVVRCQQVFGEEEITIVSQDFHNHRALFIARFNGLQAVAYNAGDPHDGLITKTNLREVLARCKAVLDLFVIRKQARFLDKKIELPN